MNTHKLAWNDFQVLLAVARHGSLSKAAEALGSSHPTLFRRIRAIEIAVGATLFERSRQGYRATEAAAALLALAGEFEQRLHELDRDSALAAEGRLTVTTTETLVPHVVPPLLARCRAALPKVSINLLIDERLANIRQREADIALRAGGEPEGDLIGRVVCDIGVAMYAPLDWPAVDTAALQRQPWITVDDTLAHLASSRWLQAQGLIQRAAVRCSSTLAVARLMEAGLGIGILPCYLGDSSAQLRRISPPLPEFRSQLWLLTPRQLRGVPRVSAALECLTAGLRDMADLFEGRRGL
ncbi:LysR family transcriptional regulator [Pseudoduganella ginsengisoli]|uniref:LysR family transcriptional regulator n=1 Tax=Pseudoduganella ginsengisoli TaxID=1462440 RepID=A0A6L6PXB4_9BURK|nr:LysR family transcriptional regulator [Pseudoduganella ginsengisoli]MTW02187.1 LysR family transcriptional regulator [Pseudoduganella ginsengisoli]